MERARDNQRELFMCFIDYKKAFDCLDHQRLWNTLKGMGVPEHLIVMLSNLYTNQEATIRTEYGETGNIPIGKGVRQGCIISPLLFNIYAENIMREALDKWNKGIGIGGRKVSNLRYADDTTLIAGNREDLIKLIEKVKSSSEKAGLYLNVKKTKVMTTGELDYIIVDGGNIEVVDRFVFLGALITSDGQIDMELRRIAMGKSAMGSLKKICKDRDLRLVTKVKIVQTLIFPIMLYGAETWTLKKKERAKIDAFEMWCWRNLLRVTYINRKTNIEIIASIKPKRMLEAEIVKLALSYFGHVVRAYSMELQLMLGKMDGQRRRGRPHITWLNNVQNYIANDNIMKILAEARNRVIWRGTVMSWTSPGVGYDSTAQGNKVNICKYPIN